MRKLVTIDGNGNPANGAIIPRISSRAGTGEKVPKHAVPFRTMLSGGGEIVREYTLYLESFLIKVIRLYPMYHHIANGVHSGDAAYAGLEYRLSAEGTQRVHGERCACRHTVRHG